MARSPWFVFVLGLVVGLAVGYVVAERQPVPPARALQPARPAPAGPEQRVPDGHPPVGSGGTARPPLDEEVGRLTGLLAQRPDDPALLAAVGNAYYDRGRWSEARDWYERSMAVKGDDPNVITDLAVVYRNLKEPERALELLRRAVAVAPDQWQAWYNTVVVLHYDLHRHDQAIAALERLVEIRRANPAVPDLAGLERDVRGGGGS